MGGRVGCLARLEREAGETAGRWDMVTAPGDEKEGVGAQSEGSGGKSEGGRG